MEEGNPNVEGTESTEVTPVQPKHGHYGEDSEAVPESKAKYDVEETNRKEDDA